MADRNFAIEDLRKKIVVAYVLQQQAQQSCNESQTQEEEDFANLSVPPPYSSGGDDRTRRPNEKPTRGQTRKVALERPSPTPINARGLRPLLLPTHVAQRDSTTTIEPSKQSNLRPLLLPGDVEERSKHEFTTKASFKTPPRIPASVSACGTVSFDASFETVGTLAAMDESEVASQPTQRMSKPVIPFARSTESLASTYGTTDNGSSGSLSSQVRETLWLPSGAGTKSDWEVHLISAYCISPGLYC